MGERDKIEGAMPVTNGEGAADDLVELFYREELRDGEFADGDDQLRSQKIDLIVDPGRAIPDLVRRRNAVAAGGSFARKTATDGSEVNLYAHLFFAHSAELLEPAEECAARGPRERSSEHRLFHAGRLADEHDFAQDRLA